MLINISERRFWLCVVCIYFSLYKKMLRLRSAWQRVWKRKKEGNEWKRGSEKTASSFSYDCKRGFVLLLFDYRINKSSRYLGSGHIWSSIINSNLSMWYLIFSSMGAISSWYAMAFSRSEYTCFLLFTERWFRNIVTLTASSETSKIGAHNPAAWQSSCTRRMPVPLVPKLGCTWCLFYLVLQRVKSSSDRKKYLFSKNSRIKLDFRSVEAYTPAVPSNTGLWCNWQHIGFWHRYSGFESL